jgi:hypothetical protein
MLIFVYTVILYLSTWTYSSDTTTLKDLHQYVNGLLRNRFENYFHNPLADLYQVRDIFLHRNDLSFIYRLFQEIVSKISN